jgi:small subunit ribosomal protein S11
MAKAKQQVRKKKKQIVSVSSGRAYIQASFNNTIVSLADSKGNVISWASAGMCGFKGPKKATPYAAGMVVKKAIEKAEGVGLKEVDVFIKGIGGGRESAIRGLNTNGIVVNSVTDMTPVPHNGCRPPKRRRV